MPIWRKFAMHCVDRAWRLAAANTGKRTRQDRDDPDNHKHLN